LSQIRNFHLNPSMQLSRAPPIRSSPQPSSPTQIGEQTFTPIQSKVQISLHLSTNPNKNPFTIKGHLHTEKTEEKNPEMRTNTQRAKIHRERTRFPGSNQFSIPATQQFHKQNLQKSERTPQPQPHTTRHRSQIVHHKDNTT